MKAAPLTARNKKVEVLKRTKERRAKRGADTASRSRQSENETREGKQQPAAVAQSQSCHLVHQRIIKAALKMSGADCSFFRILDIQSQELYWTRFCVSAHDVGCSTSAVAPFCCASGCLFQHLRAQRMLPLATWHGACAHCSRVRLCCEWSHRVRKLEKSDENGCCLRQKRTATCNYTNERELRPATNPRPNMG